jgi:thioredoxin 2
MRTDDAGVIVKCVACGKQNRIAFGRVGAPARCGQCHVDLVALAAPVSVRTSGQFDALIDKSPLPVLVDFWAEWCGPCRAVAPEVEKVASRNGGRLLVVKVDTEAMPDLATRLGIQSIPTMAVFAGGRELARTAGAMPADRIEAFVNDAGK